MKPDFAQIHTVIRGGAMRRALLCLLVLILGFCVFNQRWGDFGIAVLIMVGVYAILFTVELLKAMLDGLMGLIRAI